MANGARTLDVPFRQRYNSLGGGNLLLGEERIGISVRVVAVRRGVYIRSPTVTNECTLR